MHPDDLLEHHVPQIMHVVGESAAGGDVVRLRRPGKPLGNAFVAVYERYPQLADVLQIYLGHRVEPELPERGREDQDVRRSISAGLRELGIVQLPVHRQGFPLPEPDGVQRSQPGLLQHDLLHLVRPKAGDQGLGEPHGAGPLAIHARVHEQQPGRVMASPES